jgi:hypothetical protein
VPKPPLPMRELFPEISLLASPRLGIQIEEIWQELWQMSSYQRLEDVPVSLTIDYPQVLHTQGVLRGALALADTWERLHGASLDRDVLIGGALLIDVSKLVESSRDAEGKPRRTEVGVPLPVVHCILSHSPNGGKAPQTREAQLIDWLDQADISAFGFDIWKRKVIHYQP